MATGPGPRQIFNNIITKISFASGGLVVFAFKWNAGYTEGPPILGNNKQPASEPSVMFDFSSSPVDIGTFNIFSGEHKIVPDELDKKERDKTVPVKNPVSLDMLAHYAAWTPNPVDTKTATTPGQSTDVWIIDHASWQLVYAHHLTYRATPAGLTQEQGLQQFKGLVGSTGYEGLDPDLMGVIVSQVQTVEWPAPHDPPFPPTAEGWAVWSGANPGYDGHMQSTPGDTGYGRLTFGYWIMNLSLIKKLMPKADRNKKSFKFKMVFPSTDQKSCNWEVRAGAVQFAVQKSFPKLTSPNEDKGFLDINKAKDPQKKFGGEPKANGEIEVEITFATAKTDTKAAEPPKVKLTSYVEAGGGIG